MELVSFNRRHALRWSQRCRAQVVDAPRIDGHMLRTAYARDRGVPARTFTDPMLVTRAVKVWAGGGGVFRAGSPDGHDMIVMVKSDAM